MPINAIVNEDRSQQIKFPKLMRCEANGLILLAIGESTTQIHGTAVYSGESSTKQGTFSRDFRKSAFVDFHGEVILTNVSGPEEES